MEGFIMVEQAEKELIIKKIKALWGDKRTFANRLALAGAAIFAACFTFLFFGPLEMVAFSGASLIFTYKDVMWLLLAAAAAVFVVGTLAVSMLRGKIFNYVVAIIFSVTVAGYLQAALLNGSVGALTGEAVEWSAMKPEMAVSLMAWVAVFVVTITVLYIHRAFWRNLVIGVSVLLTFMQFAPMMGIFFGMFEDAKISEESEYYFSTEGINEYSTDENVFVFVLDYMDYDYVKFITYEDPTFFDDFEGFTGYTDAVSVFGRTKPSVCNILTNYSQGAYLVPDEEFMQKAWEAHNPNILDVLKEKGYTIDMYASMSNIFASSETALNYVSNIKQKEESGVTLIPGMMLRKLLYLSIYRYAPTAIKPFFWEYTSFYNDGVCQDDIYRSNDFTVCRSLEQGSANRSEKNFKLYHMDGAHPTCYLNRNGELMKTQTNGYEQTMGCLNLMKYVFAQMKALGIYEDATIIMTADHGEVAKMWRDDFQGMQIALFYKPSGSAEEPMVWSDAQVSTANIVATIAKATGAESSAFGVALDEVGTETTERIFHAIEGTTGTENNVHKYVISGNAADFSNWKKVDTKEVLHSFY